MRALVTGGAGFVGSNLVDALLARGDDVRVLDNFSTGARSNLLHIAGAVEIVEGDLRSFERVATAVAGCDVVFHQAALPSVPRSVQDPLTTSAVNVTGTLNLLLAARDAGVGRVVYASSSSVYGATRADRKSEDLPVTPLSPYGVSKFAAEANCRAFWEVYGLETIAIRYFNVFGPRQNPVSEYAAAVPNFIAAALLDEAATVYGDGRQSRDFTFIDNVVEANLLAAATPGVGGEVVNVAMGETRTILDLARTVGEIAGHAVTLEHRDPRRGDVRSSLADVSKARRLLGYAPAVGFEEGLRRTFDHLANDPTLIARIHDARRWVAQTAG